VKELGAEYGVMARKEEGTIVPPPSPMLSQPNCFFKTALYKEVFNNIKLYFKIFDKRLSPQLHIIEHSKFHFLKIKNSSTLKRCLSSNIKPNFLSKSNRTEGKSNSNPINDKLIFFVFKDE
jgi:hypothetical protein